MTETEERLTEEDRVTEHNPTVNTISELPGKQFGITVEVPLFLTLLSFSLGNAALNNINLYKTCVHSLNHDKAVCQAFLTPDKSNVSAELEIEVQKYVTTVYTAKTIIESIVPAILSFFLGGWSDTYGRKPLIVWPLFGKMTVLEAMVSMGSVLGGIASTYLLKAVGNVNLLLMVAAFSVLAYAYSTVFLKESLTGAVQSGGLLSVLDWLLVKDMFRECFKRRPNHGRAQILLLTVANSLSIFIMYGVYPLEYLYAREKLHWSLKDQTIFSSSSTLMQFAGAFFGVGVIQRVLPVGDLALSIVAYISGSAEYFVRTFATTTWHMYLGAGISVFRPLSSPLIRSFLTKIVPVEDIAKVFSLMCALEGIFPMLSPVVYNSLYKLTITSFPGAFYLLSGIIVTWCAVLLGFVIFYRRAQTSAQYRRLEG